MKGSLYVLLIAFVFLGCSKGRGVALETSTNSINIGGKSFAFEGAGVLDAGYDDVWEEYSNEFILTNKAISSGKDIDDFEYSLYFQAFIKDKKEFSYGTFKAGEDDMYGGIVFLEEGKNDMYMTFGSFTVSKENNGDLKIVIDGILMDGRDVKGTYVGRFSELEDTFFTPLFGSSSDEVTFNIRK